MIKLIQSTFYKEAETKELLADFIRNSKILSMGAYSKEFEELFAKKQIRRHAVFVGTGSSANLILLQALLNLGRLRKGDKVGFSAVTWATNVMPLIQLGLQPVPLDCELENLCVSRRIVQDAHKKEGLKAVFLTNVLGFCADIGDIRNYCRANSILLLEDNCESLGSRVGGELLGNFGFASTFSTYVGHHLSTIEGGMVCTDDEDLYTMLVLTRAHGWDRNLPEHTKKEYEAKYNIDSFNSKYTFYDLAYNVRPTEIQGFLGTIQINYWDEVVEKRRANFFSFFGAARDNPDIVQLNLGHMSLVSNFTMPVVLKSKELYVKYRDRFIEHGAEIRPIIAGNMLRQPFYKKYVSNLHVCPAADYIHENGFYFANNPELSEGDVTLLCSLLQK